MLGTLYNRHGFAPISRSLLVESGTFPGQTLLETLLVGPQENTLMDMVHHCRSVELQRQVYRQLGRLTKLRELTLGFSIDATDPFSLADKEYNRQYDCLAMTLESGLDLLKDLKDLRMVGLEEMEVYSDGDKEQVWFAKNWPRARVSTTDFRDMEASLTS